MKLVNSLVALATLGFATSASAAYDAYMLVVPANGTFVSATKRSKSNYIPIISFTLTAPAAPPPARAATARHATNPIVMTIDFSEVAPFTQAMTSGRLLSTVTISVMKHLNTGQAQVTETIKLKNVIVTKVQVGAVSGPKANTATISMTYEEVMTTQVKAPTTIAADSWMS